MKLIICAKFCWPATSQTVRLSVEGDRTQGLKVVHVAERGKVVMYWVEPGSWDAVTAVPKLSGSRRRPGPNKTEATERTTNNVLRARESKRDHYATVRSPLCIAE